LCHLAAVVRGSARMIVIVRASARRRWRPTFVTEPRFVPRPRFPDDAGLTVKSLAACGDADHAGRRHRSARSRPAKTVYRTRRHSLRHARRWTLWASRRPKAAASEMQARSGAWSHYAPARYPQAAGRRRVLAWKIAMPEWTIRGEGETVLLAPGNTACWIARSCK
jgi:hypothetical protein